MSIKNKSVCLLGATGFLGSAIAKELDERKISWVGISRNNSEDARIVKLSLADSDEIIKIFRSVNIVINALGSAKPRDFETAPQETLNTVWENLVLLAGLLKKSNGAKLVHISSAGTVYGEYTDKPHTETCDLVPISWYGKAKVIEELYLEKFCASNTLDYLCVRVTNPYGNERKTKHGFIDVLMTSVLSGKKFSFYENCNPIRDFIYADDMAYSIVELIKLNQQGVFNLGSGQSFSLEELANYVGNKLKGTELIVRMNHKPDFDVLINKVDIQKLTLSRAQRTSIDVFTYIDNLLQVSSKKSC